MRNSHISSLELATQVATSINEGAESILQLGVSRTVILWKYIAKPSTAALQHGRDSALKGMVQSEAGRPDQIAEEDCQARQ